MTCCCCRTIDRVIRMHSAEELAVIAAALCGGISPSYRYVNRLRWHGPEVSELTSDKVSSRKELPAIYCSTCGHSNFRPRRRRRRRRRDEHIDLRALTREVWHVYRNATLGPNLGWTLYRQSTRAEISTSEGREEQDLKSVPLGRICQQKKPSSVLSRTPSRNSNFRRHDSFEHWSLNFEPTVSLACAPRQPCTSLIACEI